MTENKFKQVCLVKGILPFTEVEGNRQEDFEKFFSDRGIRVKYLKHYCTEPRIGIKTKSLKHDGGRHDLAFYVHSDDIVKLSLIKDIYAFQWLEVELMMVKAAKICFYSEEDYADMLTRKVW